MANRQSVLRGLIVATKTVDSDSRLPCALLRLGGITLLERQVRMLRTIGVREIDVLACHYDERLHNAVTRLAKLRVHVSLCAPADWTNRMSTVSPATRWILTDGAALFDHRLPAILAQGHHDGIAVMPLQQLPAQDAPHALRLTRSHTPVAFAGCACLTSDRLTSLRPADGDAWLAEGLSHIVQAQPETIVEVASLPTYLPDMRRHIAYYWMPVRQPTDNERGKRLLLDASQKGVLDWPAWYIHRPLEKWIVSRVCEWPVTPNQITLVTNLLAFWAVYQFAVGSLPGALLTALIVGILDGVDGKQARVKQMTSRFGKIEHVFDAIYEYAWLIAMAYRLMQAGYGVTPAILCGIVIGVNHLEKILLHLFERRRGVPLDDFTPFDRGFRAVVGRRNTYMWTLIPFVAADALYTGYWVIALYALVTLLVRLWRVRVNFLYHPERVEGFPRLLGQPL